MGLVEGGVDVRSDSGTWMMSPDDGSWMVYGSLSIVGTVMILADDAGKSG